MDSASTRVKDIGPQPQSFDIERATNENSNDQSVAWSGRYLQVTPMSIPAGGDIGLEAHPQTDQFLRRHAGYGLVQMRAAKDELTFVKEVSKGWCVLVPAGTWHNITNTGATPMPVYAVHAPAQHSPDNVQAATAEADAHGEPVAWSEQPKHVSHKHGWEDRSAKKSFPSVEVCDLKALRGPAVDVRNRRATEPLYVANPTVEAGRPLCTIRRSAAVGWSATSFFPLRVAFGNSGLLWLVGGPPIAPIFYTGVYSLAATYFMAPTDPFAARSFSNSLCKSCIGPNPGPCCVGMSGPDR